MTNEKSKSFLFTTMGILLLIPVSLFILFIMLCFVSVLV